MTNLPILLPRISHHISQSLCLCRGAEESSMCQVKSPLPICPSAPSLKLVRNPGESDLP
ncbi:hypothetical protein [Nostoc sp.]|uniref:hypothetical protein n=1 Tax=Nostoc sp. TaxID=1180 RepID=UPI002FF13489